ncbi:MAG: histidine phosphatase family protein [Chlamydiota bacterium]
MEFPQKNIYLIRHGETEWTKSGQHTGCTDIDLTAAGKIQAESLGKRIKGHAFELILCSPMKRAVHTCELTGLFKHAKLEEKLKEWDYGDYEGKTTPEIWKMSPHWNVFSNGAPNGETLADIEARTSRLLQQIAPLHGDVALFSHGHFLRALAAKWLQLRVGDGRLLALSPGSLSILGFERSTPVIKLWNSE